MSTLNYGAETALVYLSSSSSRILTISEIEPFQKFILYQTTSHKLLSQCTISFQKSVSIRNYYLSPVPEPLVLLLLYANLVKIHQKIRKSFLYVLCFKNIRHHNLRRYFKLYFLVFLVVLFSLFHLYFFDNFWINFISYFLWKALIVV